MSTYTKALELSKTQPELFDELATNIGIDEDELTKEFDSLLDEEGDVTIAGIPFSRSSILKEMDYVAYRTYYLDYLDSANYVEVDGVFFSEDRLDNALYLITEAI
jgi:hypothetical protein